MDRKRKRIATSPNAPSPKTKVQENLNVREAENGKSFHARDVTVLNAQKALTDPKGAKGPKNGSSDQNVNNHAKVFERNARHEKVLVDRTEGKILTNANSGQSAARVSVTVMSARREKVLTDPTEGMIPINGTSGLNANSSAKVIVTSVRQEEKTGKEDLKKGNQKDLILSATAVAAQANLSKNRLGKVMTGKKDLQGG